MKRFLLLIALAALLLTSAAVAQETTVKGNVSGTVYDQTGAVVPAAKVTLTGATGSRTTESSNEGTFSFALVTPGVYSVKVEKSGFRIADVKNVEVYTGRTSSLHVDLAVGASTEVVEVTAGAVTVDPTSTAVGANLTDAFYAHIPVARNVSSLFQLSAGVVSGGGTGVANPSISGGSGLENMYVADGVNITDSGYGGLGVFSRVYGALGTGINLSFIKEVQVKTGGFEAQYGRGTGGIVQIVTKSGGNEYHGAIAGFLAPQELEAERLHSDDFGRVNKSGKTLHVGNFDGSGEFSGYVPGFKNRFFFFGSFNPALAQSFALPPTGSPLFSHGAFNLQTRTYSYSGKLTFKLTDSHTLESSGFGDPSLTSTGPRSTVNIDNNSAFSKLEFGTHNWVFRYNGAVSPTWLVNASVTYSRNTFTESGFANIHQIVDRTGSPRGVFTAQGRGFFENYESNNYAFNVDTQKTVNALGQHTFSLGYRLERPFYDDFRDRSGPRAPIPATNAAGASVSTLGVPASAIGKPLNASFSLFATTSACTLCPLFNVPGKGLVPVFLRNDRGEFGPNPVETNGTNHGAYISDSWSPNKYLNVNVGVRWEEQVIRGTAINYAFTDNWSPRIGVSFDPWGNRKSKFFGNFARYNFIIPLDLAIRSLSNELDFTSGRWAPDFTVTGGQRIAKIGPFGTVIPVIDGAHLLNRAPGGTGAGISISQQSTTGIAAGTKSQYTDEYVVGFERQLPRGFVLSARYMDKRFGRIVEDVSGIGPEAISAAVNQIYLIANPSSRTDIFTNPVSHKFASGGRPPASCSDPDLVVDPVEDTFGTNLGAVCYEPKGKNGQAPGTDIADGIADGFPDVVRKYQAVEIELNKAFSRNWQMRANWRIARLFGNYEGAFRNDNGQTDPSISSLFDFVQGDFGLLGDQFKPGVLNTDRRHVVNVYGSYVLDRTRLQGLELGGGLRLDSGIPINDLKAHPAYLNAGEVPVGGRGALGRLPLTGTVDVHIAYPWKISERLRLNFGMDLFNLGNAKRLTGVDQREDLSFGNPNTDFKKPLAFQRPFYARAMVRLEF